jgi:hypothetical protein
MRIPDSSGRTGPIQYDSSALPEVRSLTFTAKRVGLNADRSSPRKIQGDILEKPRRVLGEPRGNLAAKKFLRVDRFIVRRWARLSPAPRVLSS